MNNNVDILEFVKTVTTVVTATVSIFTILKAFREYQLSGIQKRVELFEKYRNKLKSSLDFKLLIELIDEDDEKLTEIPRPDKFVYLGFFEEIALLVNSRVLKPEIAHYMFGYYAISCWKSDKFWSNLNRDGIYWRVFREFVERMQNIEKTNSLISANKRLNFRI